MIEGKESKYKFFWIGDDDSGHGGVGILIAQYLVEKVASIERVDPRLICIRIVYGKIILTILSAYNPEGQPLRRMNFIHSSYPTSSKYHRRRS